MQVPPAAPERQWPPELFLERLYLQLQAARHVTVDAFIAARTRRWAKLEAMLRRSRRGRLRDIPAADLERFGALYREAASDLAIARRDFPDDDVATYLNDLCARAHPMLYRSAPLRAVGRCCAGSRSASRARSARAAPTSLLSLGLMLAGAVAGWLAVDLRPDLRASLVPAVGLRPAGPGPGQLAAQRAAARHRDHHQQHQGRRRLLPRRRARRACPTLFILAANGWMLGTIAAAVHQGGYDLAVLVADRPRTVCSSSASSSSPAPPGCMSATPSSVPGCCAAARRFSRAALGLARARRRHRLAAGHLRDPRGVRLAVDAARVGEAARRGRRRGRALLLAAARRATRRARPARPPRQRRGLIVGTAA